MKEYNFFKHYINDRNILYIPIISCINRDTNEYNLAADGNVNRFITTFSLCDTYKSLTIILPLKHIDGSEEFINKFKNDKIHIIYSSNFGIHAGEQRNNDEIVNNIFLDILGIDFDICIFESQKLGLRLMDYHKIDDKEFIFWNPVSKTKNKSRIFLEGYDTINNIIYDKVNYMIVASPDQVSYYSKISVNFDKLIYLDKLIDRDLKIFDYKIDELILNVLKEFNNVKIYYLPFRLSDEGYKLDKVLEYLKNEKENYIVLYTDPNNSHIIDKFDDDIRKYFIKVSSDRNTYYTILDYVDCTILYFEDLEFINHAAIHEFMNSKTKAKVIVYNQNNNPYNINSCDRIKNIVF